MFGNVTFDVEFECFASDQTFFLESFEQLSLQKATFDFFLAPFGQLFEKLGRTFLEISNNLWKAHARSLFAHTLMQAVACGNLYNHITSQINGNGCKHVS